MIFHEDLVNFNELNQEIITELTEFLNTRFSGGRQGLTDLQILFENRDVENGKSIIRLILYVTNAILDLGSIEAGLKLVGKNWLGKDIDVSDNVKNAWGKFETFANSIEAYFIKQKKHDLIKVLPEIDEIKFTVDVRPVFDIERTYLKDYIISTLVSIDFAECPDRKVQFELTEEELIELKKEVDKSINKIDIIKESSKKMINK